MDASGPHVLVFQLAAETSYCACRSIGIGH